MIRLKLCVLWGLLVCAAGLLTTLNGCGGGSSAGSNGSNGSNPPPLTPIQHILVVFQENRTPDNLFGSNPSFEPGADIVNANDPKITCHGTPVQLTSAPLASCIDPGHGHASFVATCNLDPTTQVCKMDGACDVGGVSEKCSKNPKDAPYRFVDNSTGTVQPYFDIATWYGFANRMFQTNQGPSFPAHQFIISGTSAPVFYPKKYYDWFMAENPPGIQGQQDTGCTAPADQYVKMIDPGGSEGSCNRQDGQHCQYPCFDHPTLTDQIDASGQLSWRYYAPSAGITWNAPTAISHICQPNAQKTACEGADWTQHDVLNPKQVLTDLGANPNSPQCNLASVSWVIPDGKYSDHGQSNDGTGPAWVASIVNAVGQDPNHCGYWSNTVILITWDDWGGWYDHVAPFSTKGYPNGGGNGQQYVYGFRIPLLVVSAYSPVAGNPGYVSNHTHDFGSILAFIEHVFGLHEVNYQYAYPYADHFAPELTEGEPYALADFFNFNQPAHQFHAISAAHVAADFLNDTRPPVDPDDDADEP